MGNRAVITFDDKPTPQSIGIYLHWNGGPESVLAFLEAADKLGVCDDSDKSYEIARLVQIIGNFFGGTTSIGIGPMKELDTDNGDNGTYIASRKQGKISIRQSKDGKNHWQELDLDTLRKHPYWTNDEPILGSVIKANAEHFKEK